MKKYLAVVLALFSLLISASEEAIDCDNALTTLDINHCASMELDRAHVEMTKYLEASYKQHACDAQIIEAITSAQEHWETYLDAHCHSVYTKWREGTIRDVMSISCRTKLTGQRTHELWENFLTYMDGASSVLPEPK